MKTLLLAALLLASPAFAAPTAAQKEELYLAICQPSVKLAEHLSEEQISDVMKERADFHAFLANPAPTVAELVKSDLKKNNGFEALIPLFQYVRTCYAAEALAEDIEARGCTDSAGKNYSAKLAVELCAPLAFARELLGK